MASMRRVRKAFRVEVERLVSAGEGNLEKLMELAGSFFGRDVGYEVLIKTFLRTEVSNAVAYSRKEGKMESTGLVWKDVATLNPEDVDIISIRSLKRLRGELKSLIRLSHEHGRADEAASAGSMLAIVNERLKTDGGDAVTV